MLKADAAAEMSKKGRLRAEEAFVEMTLVGIERRILTVADSGERALTIQLDGAQSNVASVLAKRLREAGYVVRGFDTMDISW